MANPGDKVKIITKEKEIEGILMPNESNDSVFIKLSNGYNIGIDKKTIQKTEVLKERSKKEEPKESPKEKKGLKKIVILHTGGTIASKVEYETEELYASEEKHIDGAKIKEIVEEVVGDDVSALFDLLKLEVTAECGNGIIELGEHCESDSDCTTPDLPYCSGCYCSSSSY